MDILESLFCSQDFLTISFRSLGLILPVVPDSLLVLPITIFRQHSWFLELFSFYFFSLLIQFCQDIVRS
ncbi:hypothetical protein DM02DRAFT_329700 [Periconia macrospinosa]|uniref:Uncharacterized protein n=1 Tax=Periconia macrospinosa TaxID=97972 RepID=A0A2V1DVK7_9PLEO|nr:hypothetical protein DM02DRAFT_329700 [Periconia macrospinosa]